MIYLAQSVFLLLVFLCGAIAGRIDAVDILQHIKIKHFRRRVFDALYVLLLFTVLSCTFFGQWDLRPLTWLPMAWALWTARFRFVLNRDRGEKWWYMGPSLSDRRNGDSMYDWFWHQLAWMTSGMRIDEIPLGFGATQIITVYPEKRPAKLAYGFEAIVFALFLIGPLLADLAN